MASPYPHNSHQQASAAAAPTQQHQQRSPSSSPERGSNKSPTRFSPLRVSKEELARGLRMQMDESSRRRREQPRYVAGKVGVQAYEPSPPKVPSALWQSAPSMDNSAIDYPPPPQAEMSYARRNNNVGLLSNMDPERRLRQLQTAEAYNNELQRQIEERKLREKQERERERQISRELAQDSSNLDRRRTGRAWVQPGANQHDDPIPNRATPAPYVPMAPPALTPANDMMPSPIRSDSEPSFSQRRTSEKPRFGRRASPERSSDAAPISIRHVSPERLREAELVLRSDRKLFDFEQREEYERERRAAQQQQQEELHAALQRQIEERRAAKEFAKREEARLDALMEQKARREAEQLALMERQRDEEAARAAEENLNINKQMQQRRPRIQEPAATPPAASTNRKWSMMDDPQQRSTGLNDSLNGRSQLAGGASPANGSGATAAGGVGNGGGGGGSDAATKQELEHVMQALRDIKDELIRVQSRPLVEVAPPIMIESVKDPIPPPPPAAPQPIEAGFAFVKRDTGDDEAKRILQRNQQRLAALRFAGHHDDILKAFLLQDSTAAVRTMTQFFSKQSPYQQPSPYAGGGGGGGASPGYSAARSAPRAHSSLY